ncbi:MAG: GNAT family N-acetyltransferase [Candidatus Metalachnospira sp.]|nr:GNAT family N-acetyltransferase [Candidatus Metalachnospira sp.]
MDNFRNCSIEDLNELQSISQAAYTEAFHNLLDNEDVDEYVKSKYSLDNLKKELKDISNHFLFLDTDDKTVGYMKYSLKASSLEIDRLYILKKYKGMGAGSKFMNKAEDLLILNNKKVLTLGVLEMNKPAISFYTKRGFLRYSDDMVAVGKTEYHLLLMKKELQ